MIDLNVIPQRQEKWSVGYRRILGKLMELQMIKIGRYLAMLLIQALFTVITASGQAPPESLTREEFVRLSAEMSEPGGYFDTDNLISNESSYLHVLGRMREMGISGGAFIGVGPDQSFSYIAGIRPKMGFLIDIRRDNLLQHLLYKSLFEMSRQRIEFLCLLFGRPLPAKLEGWDQRPITELADYIGKTPGQRSLLEQSSTLIESRLAAYKSGLTPADILTIRRIHAEFFTNGIELRFTSHNRAPRYYYPTYRDLILAKDLTGAEGSFLAREESFQYLKSLQERNLLIPVVGDLAGGKALKSIGIYLSKHGLTVSALYTSNVEFYLMREDQFDQFGRNVSSLPRTARSVLIRSFFNGSWGRVHPMTVPGHYSTQLLQSLDTFAADFAAGLYQGYADVVGRGLLKLK